MKPLHRLTILGALLLATVASAAGSFEGKIDLAMTSGKGQAQALTYAIMGQSMRIDMHGAPVSTIMDMGKHEMLMLMHEQRMYMSRPIPQADQAKREEGGKPEHLPDIEETGKTEVICGYTCRQFLVKDGKRVTEMWLAEGLAPFMGLGGNGMGGGGGGGFMGRKKANSEAAQKWEQALKGKGGFPLRVITRDEAGKESFKMEATKVEKGGVSAADFAVPEGYQKFQMPDLGGLNPFKRN
ncbi:MAG: DUF4412 domain-containing protein [Opitutae bacterium]|nr:DUF4412 domain-containing protein [Opitutae bacterium]